MFLWVENFRGLTAFFALLPTLSRTFIAGYICLTKNTGFFTRGGIYHYLLYDRETHFGRCPILLSPPRTPNIVLIYHVLTTYYRTPNTMSISIMHSHTHVMRCPVHKCNAMPLHVSHATCIMNVTCNNSKSYFMQSIMDNHV